ASGGRRGARQPPMPAGAAAAAPTSVSMVARRLASTGISRIVITALVLPSTFTFMPDLVEPLLASDPAAREKLLLEADQADLHATITSHGKRHVPSAVPER